VGEMRCQRLPCPLSVWGGAGLTSSQGPSHEGPWCFFVWSVLLNRISLDLRMKGRAEGVVLVLEAATNLRTASLPRCSAPKSPGEFGARRSPELGAQVPCRLLELAHEPGEGLTGVSADHARPIDDHPGPRLDSLELRAAPNFVELVALTP
jgi:hypothetical protein